MTEYEKMKNGLIYDPSDKEIMDMQLPFLQKLYQFNLLSPLDFDKKNQYMKEVFALCGDNCYIELPFHANWGGHHVHMGNNVYANFNLTLVDDGHIFIGDNVMFAPNVTVATAGHPINPSLRKRALQFVKDVHIGSNVWIGAGAVILLGVSIGDNSVIGAGSVVTKDIPSGVVAVGNPCCVKREISEKDDIFFYKQEKIDWEKL